MVRARDARVGRDISAGERLSENWRLRQFWSDEATSTALAEEVVRLAEQCGTPVVRVAFLSFPSAFAALLRRLQARPENAPPRIEPLLFEFDERFRRAYGKRCLTYDYREPPPTAANTGGIFDVFLCDIPYLTEDCLAGYAAAITALRASAAAPVLLCTSVMLEAAARALGLRRTQFQVRHTGDVFSNPFALFCTDAGLTDDGGPMGGWMAD